MGGSVTSELILARISLLDGNHRNFVFLSNEAEDTREVSALQCSSDIHGHHSPIKSRTFPRSSTSPTASY